MKLRSVRTLVAAASLAGAACVASATTYGTSSYPFSYMGATAASVTITTATTGAFTTPSAIAQFLNGSSFSAVLTGSNGILVALDNSNATWSLSLNGSGASAILDADEGRLKLGLFTPEESSGAALILKSQDGRSVFQMRKENNVTDYAFVHFAHDAVFSANATQSYNEAFAFWAVAAPVPELPSSILLVASLPVVAAVARRRRR